MSHTTKLWLIVAGILLIVALFASGAFAQGYVCRDYWRCRGQFWNDNNFPQYYPRVRTYPRYPYYRGHGNLWYPYVGNWRRW